jgi:hypothetical protein
MSEAQLREDLTKLKDLLNTLPSDDAQRARLAALLNDMEKHVEQHGAGALAQGFRQQLEAAVTRFESSHPTAAAIINDVLVTLGNMGV